MNTTFNLINLIAWLCLIFLRINAVPKELRIAGGTIAKMDQFPFFAQLKLMVPSNLLLTVSCGASLIRPQWLLSTAHCFEMFKGYSLQQVASDNYFQVYMGTNIKYDEDAVINYINEVHIHPKFHIHEVNGSLQAIRHDVAVLRLRERYHLNKFINTVRLPVPIRNYNRWIKYHRIGFTVGTGLTELPVANEPYHFSTYVLYAKQRLVSINLLKHAFEDLLKAVRIKRKNEMFVLTPLMGGHTLAGDSGGPFIVYHRKKPILHGMTSFGGPIQTSEGVLHFGAFERVDRSLRFIYKIISDTT